MNRKLLLLAMCFHSPSSPASRKRRLSRLLRPSPPQRGGGRTARAGRDRIRTVHRADVPFDIKGFAGTFTGTLPCADCPGIDTQLVLNADGTYKLHEVYQGKPGNFDGDGTWTAEEDGKRIRLDPNSKSEQDRLFAVTSKDEIESLELEDKAIESKLSYTLKREGAAQ